MAIGASTMPVRLTKWNGQVLAQFKYADRYFYLGPWTIRHMWLDRRHYLLPIHSDFHKAVYLKVLEDLEELGASDKTS